MIYACNFHRIRQRMSRKTRSKHNQRPERRRRTRRVQRGGGFNENIKELGDWITALRQTGLFNKENQSSENQQKWAKRPDDPAHTVGLYTLGDLKDESLRLPPRKMLDKTQPDQLQNPDNTEFNIILPGDDQEDAVDIRSLAATLRSLLAPVLLDRVTPNQFKEYMTRIKRGQEQDPDIMRTISLAESLETAIQRMAGILQPEQTANFVDEQYYPLTILSLLMNTDMPDAQSQDTIVPVLVSAKAVKTITSQSEELGGIPQNQEQATLPAQPAPPAF